MNYKMVKKKNPMNESILVCVNYGPNGERLIKRGCKIAEAFNCPLYILTVDSKPFDELDAEKSSHINKWHKLAQEGSADEFIMRDNEERRVCKVIAEVAREKGTTQIIIGQAVHSAWEQLAKESIINSLIKEIPFVDIHIVSVDRNLKDPYCNYHKGVRAYLVEESKGEYRLVFKYTDYVEYEGIFFKEVGTDFNNGIFRFINENQTIQVEVIEDFVRDFTNVDLETNEDIDE